MDRKATISAVRKASAQLSVNELEKLIAQKAADTVSGRPAKKVQEWTLFALQELLSVRKESEAEEMARLSEEEESARRLDDVVTVFQNVRGSLHDGSAEKPEWTLSLKTRRMVLPKAAILTAFDTIVLSVNNQRKALSEESGEISQPLYIMSKPAPDGKKPDATSIDENEYVSGRFSTIFYEAERQPEWQSIEVMGRVSERLALANVQTSGLHAHEGEQSTQPGTVNILDQIPKKVLEDAVWDRSTTKLSVLLEIGGERLLRAAETIVTSLHLDPPLSGYWHKIVANWEQHQRTLDDLVTMLPPKSIREALERLYTYLDLLSSIPEAHIARTLPLPTAEIRSDVLQDIAANAFNNVPKQITAESVASAFPHFELQDLQTPGIHLAKEGSRTIYLMPMDTYVQTYLYPQKHEGINAGRTMDPLLIKQRAAALLLESEFADFKPSEWMCGEFLDTDAIEQKSLEKLGEAMRNKCIDSTSRVIEKLGLPEKIKGVAAFALSADWTFVKGGKTYSKKGATTSMPIRVDFDFHPPTGAQRQIGIVPPNPMSPPGILFISPAPSTELWLGMILTEHACTTAVDGAITRKGGEEYLPVAKVGNNRMTEAIENAFPDMATVLNGVIEKAKQTIDTTQPDWPMLLLENTEFLREAMRHAERLLTRIPPKSLTEVTTRMHVLGNIISHVLVPESLTLYAPFGLREPMDTAAFQKWTSDMDQLTMDYFETRPIPADLKENMVKSEPFHELFDALGIDADTLPHVRFLREGSAMRFICPKEYLPTHPVFHRMIEQNDERTLDLIVADDETRDKEIEQHRGKWISGTLPSLQELESELFHINAVEGKVLPAPEREDGELPDREVETPIVSGEETSDKNVEPIPRLKAVRNALLRLGIGGDFTLDERTSAPKTYDLDSAEPGHYVIVTIPSANMQILVSDDHDKGTRIIYNVLDAQHYTTLDIGKLDEELGRIRLRYNGADQFTSIVQSSVAQRLHDPSPVYPVDSDYPSPLDAQDTFGPETMAAFLRDFGIAAKTAGKELHQLTVGDFGKIKSEDTVWSFGGAACGTAYLDRIAREFCLHAVSVNRKIAADASEATSGNPSEQATVPENSLATDATALEESPTVNESTFAGPLDLAFDGREVRQSDFRTTVLRMILWEISPEYKEAQVKRAESADRYKRKHSRPPVRQKRTKTRPEEPGQQESY